MNPPCVIAIAPTVPPTDRRPNTVIATISNIVRVRIALSFLLEPISSSCQAHHLVRADLSSTQHIPLSALHNRDVLQSGTRLLVLSRVDRTFCIPLLQRFQRLVMPRTHLTCVQTTHHPDHQQDNGYPEEHHHTHS